MFRTQHYSHYWLVYFYLVSCIIYSLYLMVMFSVRLPKHISYSILNDCYKKNQ